MDWTPKIPPYDSQYSANTHTDAEDCVEESLCHILFMMTGKRYSPRALGYNVDVTPNGSSMNQATDAVAQKGVTLYDLWPTPDSFTWESYYETLSDAAASLIDKYNINLIPPDLDKSPLWTVLRFPDGSQHAVAQINDTQYFDSETGKPIKPLDYQGAVVVGKWSIEITPIPPSPQDFYVKSSGFTPEMFAAFTPEVQAAIKFNDAGGRNIIFNGQIVVRDPNFTQ
jgi:hypothetical protein